uniref:hypothetical protein n=2 Tax=Microbacterium sp. CPCC 204701 TaxID=2493084 RepID=UPI000FD9CD53|nr:hypothetical protein [Microbacterium sp. CPCC 204701]
MMWWSQWGFMVMWVVLPIVVATTVVGVVVRSRRTRQAGGLSRLEEWVVALVGTGALLVAAGSIAALTASGIQTFASDPSHVRGFTIGSVAAPTFAERSSAVVDAGYESAWLDVTGLPVGARWLLYLEVALPILAALAIGVATAWLAIGLLRGRPFVRSLPNVVGVAAIAVMVGGLGSQAMAFLARGATIEFLGPRVITAGDKGDGPYEGLAMSLTLDLAPIGWAFGLALVAAAFQIGTRMQQDTEALV